MIRRNSFAGITHSDNHPYSSKKTDKNDLFHLLHIKCPAICLVKEQIRTLNTKVIDELEGIQQCRSFGNRLWKHRFTILLILLPIFLWLALVYGALNGAALCGGGTCDGSSSKRNLVY